MIPKAIGGRLAVDFLCKQCNERLGYSVEAKLKSDPRLVLAIDELKGDVPDLAERMLKGQTHFARVASGIIRAAPTSDGYTILDSPQEDGSFTKGPFRARQEVTARLRRHRATDEEVARALAAHDAAPENVATEVAPGLTVIKGKVEGFTPTLRGGLADDRGFLSIAYQFIPLVIGTAVYDPALQPVRDALLGDGGHEEHWSVESAIVQRPHEPFHGISLHEAAPHAVIQIRLFAQHAWLVHFSRIAWHHQTKVTSYTVNLVTGVGRVE